MSRLSIIAMWLAVVLLICVYVFPLWEIRLHAPQYPQGLGIDIWVSKITGAEPHDLQNINGLNHYIGMKAIEPDAIPELRFMKWVVAGLVLLGAVVALLRRKTLFAAWVVLAVALSVLGMWDFYKWEYDYGHNLDPSAAIKIPGMSYQPPLFGTKQLLNFTTSAWPGVGGICAMLAVGLAALALLWDLRRRGPGKPLGAREGTPVRAAAGLAALLALLALGACSKAPHPIEYGVDACDYCRMSIADDRYGAEIVSKKGRAYKYDAVECMVHALLEGHNVAKADVAFQYTTDFANRGTLLDAEGAVFLHSENLPSPMGMNLTSFAKRADAEEVRKKHGGEILDWAGARGLVASAHTPGTGTDGRSK
jgi:copper chaperone NosL